MPNYAIIARTPDGVIPALGTIVPEDMAQPNEVETIPLSATGYDPGEFHDLAYFLRQWGYEPGHLPPNGAQLQRAGVV